MTESEKRKILLTEETICEIERIIRHGGIVEVKKEKNDVLIIEIKRRVTQRTPITG